jgi:hypothetical protein
MAPITRLEEWIAPRALKVLAVIAALVLALGAGAAYLIRQHDLQRVDHLERVIRCQDSRECRSFIYRAIRDFLEHRERRRAEKGGKDRPAVIFRFRDSAFEADIPEFVEAPVGSPAPSQHHERETPDRPAKAPQAPAEQSPAPSVPQPPPPEETEAAPGNSGDHGEAKGNGSLIEPPPLPVTACVPKVICPKG